MARNCENFCSPNFLGTHNYLWPRHHVVKWHLLLSMFLFFPEMFWAWLDKPLIFFLFYFQCFCFVCTWFWFHFATWVIIFMTSLLFISSWTCIGRSELLEGDSKQNGRDRYCWLLGVLDFFFLLRWAFFAPFLGAPHVAEIPFICHC